MSVFVCSLCKQVIRDPFKQYVQRIEFRRLDGSKRPHVKHVRDLCLHCMEKVWTEIEGRSGIEQDSLL